MIADQWWIDALRVACVALAVVGVVLICLRARRARAEGDVFTVPATGALTTFALFVIVQEMQQVGKPFVPWRLPLLAIGSTLTIIAVRRSRV